MKLIYKLCILLLVLQTVNCDVTLNSPSGPFTLLPADLGFSGVAEYKFAAHTTPGILAVGTPDSNTVRIVQWSTSSSTPTVLSTFLMSDFAELTGGSDFGMGIHFADINFDGILDLIIGCPGHQSNKGAFVTVFLDASYQMRTVAPTYQVLSTLTGAASGSLPGFPFGSGYRAGGTFTTLGTTTNSGIQVTKLIYPPLQTGATQLLFLRSDGKNTGFNNLGGDSNFLSIASLSYGSSIHNVGDIDNNGWDDVLVTDTGVNSKGAAFLLFLVNHNTITNWVAFRDTTFNNHGITLNTGDELGSSAIRWTQQNGIILGAGGRGSVFYLEINSAGAVLDIEEILPSDVGITDPTSASGFGASLGYLPDAFTSGVDEALFATENFVTATDLVYTPPSVECTGTDFSAVDADCNSEGYCINGACSCLSGVTGTLCDVPVSCGSIPPLTGFPSITPTLSSSLISGQLDIDITLPIQDSTGNNRATWTTVDFTTSASDACDYPNDAVWTKSASGCDETFSFSATYSFARECLREVCYKDDVALPSCTIEDCPVRPCTKRIEADISIAREYVKTTGPLERTSTSTYEFQFGVVYPWLISFTTSSPITFQNEIAVVQYIVLESSNYDVSNDEWVFVIAVAVDAPYKLSTTAGTLDFGAGPITPVISDCTALDTCVQTITFTVTGCDTFQSLTSFTSTGFEFICNAENSCPGPDPLDISFDFQGPATCADLEENITPDTGETTFVGYTANDWAIEATEFAAGETAYFVITAADSSTAPLTGVDLVSLESTAYPGQNQVSSTTEETCPFPSKQHCFGIPANSLAVLNTPNAPPVTGVVVTATLELSYTGQKRTIQITSQSAEISKEIMILKERPEESSSILSSFAAMALLIALW